MAAYAVTDKVISGTPADVAADAETYLETLDDSKTIHISESVGDNMWQTLIIIHDA